MELVSVNERRKILKDELRRMVNIIKVKYKPDKVILFGSFARGEVHRWSDIDLLIIKDTKQRPIDRCVRLARLVRPKVGVDLFVYTPQEYEFLLKERFSLLIDILREGKVLYEKRN